jgi:hypothetical protein
MRRLLVWRLPWCLQAETAGAESNGARAGGSKGLHVFEQSLEELPRDHAGQRPEAVPRPKQQQERQPLFQRRPPGCQHGPAGCSVRCEPVLSGHVSSFPPY